MDGLGVSTNTVGYVCLGVDTCSEMKATMLPEIIAMSAEESQDPRHVDAKLKASQ